VIQQGRGIGGDKKVAQMPKFLKSDLFIFLEQSSGQAQHLFAATERGCASADVIFFCCCMPDFFCCCMPDFFCCKSLRRLLQPK
jgi:hypothetical protein